MLIKNTLSQIKNIKLILVIVLLSVFTNNAYSCKPLGGQHVYDIVVYKWVDRIGFPHISDKPPKKKDYHDLTVKNMKLSKLFTLNLDKRDSELPVFTYEKMKRDIGYIYKILTDSVGVSKINYISLDLTLFDDENEFNDYKYQMAPSLGAAGGFYIPSKNQATIFIGEGISEQRMFDVTRHEATHAIVDGAFGRIPTWLNEGLAEYFEQLTLENVSKVIHVNKRHVKLLSEIELPDLVKHFKLSRNEWYNEKTKKNNYALAWSLVYFMMSSEKDQEFLKYMLDHIAFNHCKTFSDRRYINQHYPGGLKQFESNWKNWLVSEKTDHWY